MRNHPWLTCLIRRASVRIRTQWPRVTRRLAAVRARLSSARLRTPPGETSNDAGRAVATSSESPTNEPANPLFDTIPRNTSDYGEYAELYECDEDAALARAERLLAAGQDVNATNAQGMTPLIKAIIRGKEPFVRLFLSHGADPNQALPNGNTPLMLAIRCKDQLCNLLLNCGAHFDTKDDGGMTALMVAASERNPTATRLLLERGADVNAAMDGTTALEWAQRRDSFAVADLLVRGGADVNARSRYGFTLLMGAARRGKKRWVEWLLERGADVTAATDRGHTALSLAQRHGLHEIAALIENAPTAGNDH